MFRDLTLSLTTVERELIAYERIRKYMDYEIDNVNYNTSSVFFKYELIRFEDVWLDYGDEFNHIYALKGISFTIN